MTLTAAAFVASAAQAFAAAYADDIAAQLVKQGFRDISTETTWLGRLRILASRNDGHREIILNPRTGEILRDLWTTTNGYQSANPIVDNVGAKSGSDSSGADESGSAGTDDGPDDRTGGASGGGSSGSGSGSGSDPRDDKIETERN